MIWCNFCILARHISFSAICLRNHYEILGVSNKATQADIKTAYYKLSMQHHPDRQDGNREEFEKITEAYKILGDHITRKLYDKGAFQDESSQTTSMRNYHERSAPHTKRPDVPSGRTPLYDFDMWTRHHYGNIMERRATAKKMYSQKMNSSKNSGTYKKENVTIGLIFLIVTVSGFSLLYQSMFDDFDQPKKTP